MLLQTLADGVGVGASYGQDDALDGQTFVARRVSPVALPCISRPEVLRIQK